ncbi:unnamed protein product [Choristocarpus tenellus]
MVLACPVCHFWRTHMPNTKLSIKVVSRILAGVGCNDHGLGDMILVLHSRGPWKVTIFWSCHRGLPTPFPNSAAEDVTQIQALDRNTCGLTLLFTWWTPLETSCYHC